MPLRLTRSGALALALAVPFFASAPSPFAPPRSIPTRHAPPAVRHVCDRTAYVVGDSRRTLEHEVLPRTTDLVWARQLGTAGGDLVDGMRHVRYLAGPGVVHEAFVDDLARLMARCTRGERPLVFDFMGTNYAVQHPERIGDPAFYREIEQTIVRFYLRSAPQARVVLAELTLNAAAAPDAATRAGIEHYLAGYNAVLRDLARRQPARFFFLPAPAVYATDVAWRDAAHETAEAPLADYERGTYPGALDAAGVALVRRAEGSTCALLADGRFGAARYSEGVTLAAYLQDFRRSPAAQRWLTTKLIATNARVPLARQPQTCPT